MGEIIPLKMASDKRNFMEVFTRPGDIVLIAPRVVPEDERFCLPYKIEGFKPAQKLTSQEWLQVLSVKRWSLKRYEELLFIIPRPIGLADLPIVRPD